jgi:hypothetical protein
LIEILGAGIIYVSLTVDGVTSAPPVRVTILGDAIGIVNVSNRDYVYEERTLQLNVSPQIDVEWTSSNTAIATVDANGIVTGITPGDVVITATAIANPGVSDTITITVRPLQIYTIAAWRQGGMLSDAQTHLPSRTPPALRVRGGGAVSGNPNQLVFGGWTVLGHYWYAEVDTTGLSNITVSSEQRAVNSDLDRFVLEYSVNGGAWRYARSIEVCSSGLGDVALAGRISNHELSEEANNATSLRVRWRNTVVASGGVNARNIIIEGSGATNLDP